MRTKIKKNLSLIFRKSIAIFVSVCFILSESVSYAAPISSPRTSASSVGAQFIAPDEGRDTSSSAAKPRQSRPYIEIPSDLGRIEESFVGHSGKTIIYLQDAHDSLEAQENIAKLIQYFVQHYGVKTVFEEGYEGLVPTDDYFGFIKDPQIKEKVSYFFMDKLRLGGAEYAHITRTKDFQLIGADNLKLHKKNIEKYQESAKHRKETEKDLAVMDAAIRTLTQQYFTKDLKEWMGTKERFDRQEIELLDYLRRTQTLFLKRIGFEEFGAKYPNISLLLSMDKTKDEKLLSKLKVVINYKTLFEEINRLEDDYARAHLKEARDREIFRYYKLIQLLKRLNAIEITEEEYEAVKENLKKIDTVKIAQFLAAQSHKSVMLSKAWEAHIQSAVEFYEVARERDASIRSRLEEYRKNDSKEPVVLVYGGFHKGSIKELLSESGLSYSIMMPKITSLSVKHQEYYKQLMRMGYDSLALPSLVAKATSPPRALAFPAENPGAGADRSLARLIHEVEIAAQMTRAGENQNILHEMDLLYPQAKSRNNVNRAINRFKNTRVESTMPQATARSEVRNYKNWGEKGKDRKILKRWLPGFDLIITPLDPFSNRLRVNIKTGPLPDNQIEVEWHGKDPRMMRYVRKITSEIEAVSNSLYRAAKSILVIGGGLIALVSFYSFIALTTPQDRSVLFALIGCTPIVILVLISIEVLITQGEYPFFFKGVFWDAKNSFPDFFNHRKRAKEKLEFFAGYVKRVRSRQAEMPTPRYAIGSEYQNLPLDENGRVNLKQLLVPSRFPKGDELKREIQFYIESYSDDWDKLNWALENLKNPALLPYMEQAREFNVLLVVSRKIENAAEFEEKFKPYLATLMEIFSEIPQELLWELSAPIGFEITRPRADLAGFQNPQDTEVGAGAGMTYFEEIPEIFKEMEDAGSLLDQGQYSKSRLTQTVVHELLGHHRHNSKRPVYQIEGDKIKRLEGLEDWEPIMDGRAWRDVAKINGVETIEPFDRKTGEIMGLVAVDKLLKYKPQQILDIFRSLYYPASSYYYDLRELVAFSTEGTDLSEFHFRPGASFGFAGGRWGNRNHQLKKTRRVLMESNARIGLPVVPQEKIYLSYLYDMDTNTYEKHYLQKSGSDDNRAWNEVVFDQNLKRWVSITPSPRAEVRMDSFNDIDIKEANAAIELLKESSEQRVEWVTLSPDGKYRFLTFKDPHSSVLRAKVQALEKGTSFEIPIGNGLKTISFSPDGKYLAVKHNNVKFQNDGPVKIFDLQTGEDLKDLIRDARTVFLQEGQWVWLRQRDESSVRVFNLGQRKSYESLTGSHVFDVTLSPDERWLDVRYLNHIHKVFNLETGESLEPLIGPDVQGVHFSTSSNLMAVWYDYEGNKSGAVIDLKNKKKIKIELGNKVSHVAFSPDETRLVTKTLDGMRGEIFDLVQGKNLADIIGADASGFEFSQDGQLLAVLYLGGKAKIFNFRPGTPTEISIPFRYAVKQITFLGNGNRVLVKYGGIFESLHENTADIFDIATQKRDSRFQFGTGISEIFLSPNQGLLISLYGEKGYGQDRFFSDSKVFNAETGEEVILQGMKYHEIRRVSFSPDGKWITVYSRNGIAAVFDTLTGKNLEEIIGEDASKVTFSPNGRWAAVQYSSRKSSKVFDLKDKKDLENIVGNNLAGALFFPDSERIDLKYSDGTAHIINLKIFTTNPLLQEGIKRWKKNAHLGFGLLVFFIQEGIFKEEDFRQQYSQLLDPIATLVAPHTYAEKFSFLQFFVSTKIFEYLRKIGGNPTAHFQLYMSLIARNKGLSPVILEGLFEAVRRGWVSGNLEDNEAERVLNFVRQTHDFNLALYEIYKKEGSAKLDEALSFGNKILKDEAGPLELKAFEEKMNKEGYNGPQVLLAVILKVIPVSMAAHTRREKIVDLWRRYQNEEDRRGDIPETLRRLGEFGGGTLRKVEKRLKTGATLDPAKDAGAAAVYAFLNPLLRQGLSDNRSQKLADKKIARQKLMEFIQSFPQVAGERYDENKRKEALSAFLAYASYDRGIREKSGRIVWGNYLGLELLEQLFDDVDNLPGLLGKWIEKEFPQNQNEPIRDAGRLKSALQRLWSQKELSLEERSESLRKMMLKISEEAIRREIMASPMAPDLKQELQGILETRVHLPLPPKELTQILLGPARTIIQKEKEKFEDLAVGDLAHIKFRIVKGPAFGLWGPCAGVCVDVDRQLWRNQNFYLLIMIDEITKEVVGISHLFQKRFTSGESYHLTVPGINPRAEFLEEANPEEVYKMTEEALQIVANAGGFKEIDIPWEGHIHSNRNPFKRLIMERGYHVRELPSAVEWNTKPEPYPFQKVFVLPKRSEAGPLDNRKKNGDSEVRSEVRKIEGARSARLNRSELVNRLQEKYAVVIDMNVFDALSKEQQIEVKKLIHARSDVKFIFNVVGDRRLDSELQELMDFRDRYKNIDIRIDPVSFDFQGRKVINVSKEGMKAPSVDFIEKRLSQSKDLYRVRYREADKEAGLLTAALLLLESKPEAFIRQGRYFSEVPPGLKADIEAFLLTYVYVGRSA